MTPVSNPLADRIRAEIAETGGAIPFVRFMELALYSPGVGYYERSPDVVGRLGDFTTSPSVGALFGELLAFQFCEWLDELASVDEDSRIIEAGSHEGQLADDILHWMKSFRPARFERLTYTIVEPSIARQAWQRDRLQRWGSRISWADSAACALGRGAQTAAGNSCPTPPAIVFSNELLDAFPCHRIGWNAQDQCWFEWGVKHDNERFQFCRMNLSSGDKNRLGLESIGSELRAVLPEGFTLERCPAASQWWRETAGAIQRGYLVTVDYGLLDTDFLAPHRAAGTLRAYRQHQLCTDPLADPGLQDLTAHVDFQQLISAGESAGLETELFQSQEQFLMKIFARTLRSGAGWGEWTPAKIAKFKTLSHPEHFGRAFRVLVQRRKEK